MICTSKEVPEVILGADKKALIVAAKAGFIRGFLVSDIHILKNLGYEVHCAANNIHSSEDGTNYKQFFEDLGTTIHPINFSSISPLSFDSMKSYQQINSVIKHNQFDLIHCHTPIAGTLTRLAAIRARRKGTKVIYTSHGFYFHKGASKKIWFLYYNIEKFASRLTDTIITINWEDYHSAKSMFCKDVRHINGVGINTLIYQQVMIDRKSYRESIGVKSEDVMILSIGELSVRKNHQVIIKALKELKNNFVLVVCGKAKNGEGTYLKLRQMTAEYGVRVIFLGFRSDIPELCHCADIGALSSIREGLGMAGLELLASGVVLVASNVHGIMDYMKHGITGYVCNPYDHLAFAEAFTKLEDPNIREAMKNDCIESAMQFDIKISLEQRMKIYDDLLELRG